MKNWLTVGQFSKAMGVSAKALRLYEKMGLLKSHARGENGYRYYAEAQLPFAKKLKEFKDLGFSLAEIKNLLESDQDLDSEKIKRTMLRRLKIISQESAILRAQRKQIENILSSLEKKSTPLKADERRVIMSLYGKVAIVVTGVDGLEKTAEFIQQHFKKAQQDVPVFHWQKGFKSPVEKPYILVLPEESLKSKEVAEVNGDVIVIKTMSMHSSALEKEYLKLFGAVGPHVSTVVNADDRASVNLMANSQIQKGRIFYYSKNSALKKQIKHIGGVLSSGDELDIYGFNLKSQVHMKIEKIMALEEEVAFMSSLAAVMTLGLEQAQLQTV